MSVIGDMNSIRPLPTLAREGRALAANVVFAAVVLGVVWTFEVPVVIPAIVIGAVVVLLAARLVYRAVQGDEQPAAVAG